LEALTAFRQYLEREREYSPHTVLAYTRDISFLIEWVKTRTQSDVLPEHWYQDITHRQLRAWMAELLTQGVGARSLARKIASINAFYRFLQKTELTQKNPASRVSVPKIEKKLPVWLKPEETRQLFDSIPFSPDFLGTRDQLILEILYGCGLRRAELLNLSTNDIYLSKGVMKVKGKGNKERLVPFGDHVKTAYLAYLPLAEAEGFNVQEILFRDKSGKPLGPRQLHTLITQYIGQVSTLTQRSPHVLRHTFATHLLNEGADLNAIKEMLGHTSLAATQVYVHNSIAKLKQVYQKSHPKA
jgi:integrase/recombinase XerC